MKLSIISAFLLSVFFLAGCSENRKLPVGKDIIVQLDRSALGAGANLPISPTTENINGADTAIRGKLIFISPDWLEIESIVYQGNESRIKTFWISRSKVLLIQTDAIKRD